MKRGMNKICICSFQYLNETADTLDGLPFKLHDFGFRGSTSTEVIISYIVCDMCTEIVGSYPMCYMQYNSSFTTCYIYSCGVLFCCNVSR